MSLKNLSDSSLLEKVDQLVTRERELLSEILQHLKEIERRRLFSELGYKSLFEYATRRLGYAEDQAARRISAMRLLKELPELETKVSEGSLTLTNLSMAQTFFRQEQKSQKGLTSTQKLEILASLENKSKREAEKLLLGRSSEPEHLQSDRVRLVSEDTVEIKFMIRCDLQDKLERVKGLLAHANSNMSMADLLDVLCDMAIKKLDPAEKVLLSRHKLAKTDQDPHTKTSPAPDIKRRIENVMRRQVWKRAGSRCQNCDSVHALQVDHIKPLSLGGTHQPENLRLLCRSCNQRAAIKKLGLSKMQRFLDKPVGR